LHGGNGAIVPISWQPLPGEPAAKIRPYLRRVDNVFSASYKFGPEEIEQWMQNHAVALEKQV